MIKKYFYYYRDDRNRPIVTVCSIINFYGTKATLSARGLSFCHEKDNPDKVSGKRLAEERAGLALTSQESQHPVSIREEFHHILEVVPYNDIHILEYKSCFSPTPTDIEKRFIKNSEVTILNEDDGEID